MTLCSTEDSKVVPCEPLGDVFKVTFGNIEDSQGNRVALGGIYYRITCRRQFTSSQSFVVSNTLNIKPGGYFYARQGYRIDVTARTQLKVDGDPDSRDKVKFWLQMPPLMNGKSKVRSEPKLDPMLLTWGQPAAKQSRQVRQSLSKQPVNLLDVHVNLDFTTVKCNPELFGPTCAISEHLPRERKITLSNFVVDYCGQTDNNETRLRVGEHNGENWVLPPTVLNMTCANSQDQARVNVFQADTRVQITVYTQLRFVFEKLEWFGEDEARATTIVAGFMNCKSKAKVGNRSVILRGGENDHGNKATLKVTLTDGDHVEPNKLTEIETTRTHHSDLMRVLNPIPNREIVAKIAAETKTGSVQSAVDIVVTHLISHSNADASWIPSRIRVRAQAAEEVEMEIRLVPVEGQSFHAVSRPKRLHLNLDSAMNRQVCLEILDAQSNWVTHIAYIDLNSLQSGSGARVVVDCRKSDDFELFNLQALKIDLIPSESTFNIYQSLDNSINLSTIGSMQTRGQGNFTMTFGDHKPTDKELLPKISKLKKYFSEEHEAAQAEKMRLSRLSRMKTFDESDLALTKKAAIFSTLVESATEYVHLIGIAGERVPCKLPFHNQRNKELVLILDSLPKDFSMRPSRHVSRSSTGTYSICLPPLIEAEILFDFFPIYPQPQINVTLDLRTNCGSVYHRFFLRGFVLPPRQYSSINLIEAENIILKKNIPLPIALSSTTTFHNIFFNRISGKPVVGHRFQKLSANELEFATKTPSAPDELVGWLHFHEGHRWRHSIKLTVQAAVSLGAQTMDQGTYKYISVPFQVPISGTPTFHYSHAIRNMNIRYCDEALPIVQDYPKFGVYAHSPGNYRRMLRICISGMVIQNYIFTLQVEYPKISKEMELYLKGSKNVRKRIAIHNPYEQPKTFKISSSCAKNAIITRPEVQLGPDETGKIELIFSGVTGKYYVFINDENNLAEDAFAISVF